MGGRPWRTLTIWTGDEGIPDVGSSMNRGPEAGMSTARGKVSEGTATAGAEHGLWRGRGEKTDEALWGLFRDGPRTLTGFFSTGCSF